MATEKKKKAPTLTEAEKAMLKKIKEKRKADEALTTQENALLAKIDTQKAETFKRLATSRMNKAIGAIANVGNLAKPKAYRFDAEAVAKINTALSAAVEAVRKNYEAALSGKSAGKTGGFSL